MKVATKIVNCSKLLVLLALLVLSHTALAGISIFANGKEVAPHQMGAQWVFDSSNQHDLARWRQVRQFLQPVGDGKIDMSYKQGMFWVSLEMKDLPINDSVIYLEVHNPHINFLGAWILDGDHVVKAYNLTGDHLPFYSRNVFHSQFVYKISLKNKKVKLLLMIDKRNEQLHLPLNFFNDEDYIVYNRNNNLISGFMVGIAIFILLFTVFLYFNIRERLYVYYALYVFMIGGYIFTDLGLSFMFLYPNVPAIADLVRPFFISQAPIYYILFSRNLLNVKQHFSKMFLFTKWFLGGFILCFAIGFGLPNDGPLRIFWLVLMQVVMVAAIIPVLVFSIMGVRKKVKYSGYIVMASLLFTIFTQIYMQYITGNLPDNAFTRNAVNIGFSVEIILLALALSIRFKNYKLEAEALLMQLNQQQENIFKNISEYQQKEMIRLSGMLHDSVGAGLSSIKFNLEAAESSPERSASILKSTIEDVTSLTDEVRTISHNLSPLLLQKKGLLQGLEDLIQQYNRTGQIRIYLESIGSKSGAAFQNELLVFRIIQELLQNAVKHAQATEIIIQIILEEEIISIYVEDNGRGFDRADIKDGLGFSQIKGLITFVNGRFEVDSQVNKGCRISIEFPTIPNETTDKSTAGRRSPYVLRWSKKRTTKV